MDFTQETQFKSGAYILLTDALKNAITAECDMKSKAWIKRAERVARFVSSKDIERAKAQIKLVLEDQ